MLALLAGVIAVMMLAIVRIIAPLCGPMSWACVDGLSIVVTFVRGAVEGHGVCSGKQGERSAGVRSELPA
jgi:hypothetical protein